MHTVQPVPPSKRPSTTSSSSGAKVGCLVPLMSLPMLVFFIPMFIPLVMLRGCGFEKIEHQVIEYATTCPDAVALLGDAPKLEYGFGMGNFEIGGGTGYIEYGVPIQGSKASGRVHFHATQAHYTWRFHEATLSVDGASVDLLACQAKR